MKAIQIKVLPCTDTKPTRLKAWAEGVEAKIDTVDGDGEIEDQAKNMADNYCRFHGWRKEIYGFGVLPNGDWVATLGE